MLKSPPEVVSIVPLRGKATRTELKVLERYIGQIRLWAAQSDPTGPIRFGTTVVEVDAWAVRALQRFCGPAQPARGAIEDLVAQGVAVIGRCRTDLAALRTATPDLTEMYARQAEMMLDVAVGTVVLRELQERCNTLLAAGRNDEARELSQFQHEVRNVVTQVGNSLGQSEKERANQFVPVFQGTDVDLRAQAEPSFPEGRTVPGAPRARRTQPGWRVTRRKAVESAVVFLSGSSARPSRFRSYAFGVVALALLAAATAHELGRQRIAPIAGDPSKSLLAALSDVAGVTQVQDRMPYMVLTVHADFWDSSGASRRRDWIEELSRLVEHHGYSGLVVRTTGGVPLAEWVRDRGVKFAGDD